ncbi:MAG: AAA family ATPase [Bacteroidales bacterium]|nr:AAA family ATPase [Bacteroidales bacterium]
MSLQNLLNYYNACYQEDNLGTRISDIFSNSVENRYFFSGKEELINGFLPYAPLETDYASEILKKIIVSSKEKELVYCSIFLAGKSETLKTKNNKICSPLVIYPAKILKIDDDFFVEIDKNERRINFGIFNEIVDEQNDIQLFYEELYKIIEHSDIDLSEIAQISKLLDKYSSNIDTSELLTFPELTDKQQLQAIFRKKNVDEQGQFMVVPTSALAIIKKSVNTRGIINELSELSKTEQFSEPVKSIFSNFNFNPTDNQSTGYVPAILNSDQENIINTSEKFPFSVIIGPPGTGKSYSISALAIEKMSKGKSVLITASTDKAVDVIAEKIENQLNLKNILVRAGRKNYRKEILDYVNSLLQTKVAVDEKNNSKQILKQLKHTERKLLSVQKIFQVRIDEELKWGKYIAENIGKTTFFVNLKRKYIEFRNQKAENHWTVEEEMQELYTERNKLINNYIQQKYNENLQQVLKADRQTINILVKALRTYNGKKQKEFFKQINFETVFKIFPIWLVKMSDIYKILPLNKELFDFVIIDEATQSNVAQALPILQRGKHAIITGDFKQLRHFSFMSQAKQNIFKSKNKVENIDAYITDYKSNSLLDIIAQRVKFSEQFCSLFEHYRSLPAIIEFSNKNFYDNKLKIMTSRPDLATNLGVEINYCRGQRDKKGINKIEATNIVKKLKEIIENEKNLAPNICSSIGVLSPFRDQVDFISKQLTEKFSFEVIEKHQISINTAYGFQGDERDIMLISFSVDNDSHASAFRYLNKADVFNVSITRARKMQYVYHSLDIKNIKYDNLLRRFLESFDNNIMYKQDFNTHDEFLLNVKEVLINNGFTVWQEYTIAGLNIDLIVKKENKIIGLDLIGYPGQFEAAFTVERYKMLHRAGLDTFPLPYTYWVSDKEACLKEIEKTAN